MTQEYENVYINDTAIISGPYEAKGPLSSYFDKSYNVKKALKVSESGFYGAPRKSPHKYSEVNVL